MYYYLYDSHLVAKKYQKTLARVENRVNNLGITGKIIKLTIIKSAAEIIRDILKRENQEETKTIVAVGSEALFTEVAAEVIDKKVVLGYVPVGSYDTLAVLLGIPTNELACDVIAARLKKVLDVGKYNGSYFISHIDIDGRGVRLKCDDAYTMTLSRGDRVRAINCNFLRDALKDEVCAPFANPRDGLLEVAVYNARGSFFGLFNRRLTIDTHLFARRVEVLKAQDGEEISINVDDRKIVKTPLVVEGLSKKITVIVGKERLIE
ncbi:MAG: hypothetical protein HYW78_04510 [Parcubacteria group bacterium]|nr:hypothetical protein [Parcubacteria group bacterium]